MLEIRLLGELEILRDGARLALPPSRKTRALLAYLVATGRRHRRDRLCSLLWDIPDDPRGALRWSLSRLRPLVDEPEAGRIVADRETVGFEPAGASIDFAVLQRASSPDELPVDDLAQLASLFRGEFLEGADLPDADEFQAWLVAEREDVRRLQVGILEAIDASTPAASDTALAYIRRLVQIDPYNAAARASLLHRLVALGRRAEAEQQLEAARRLLREIGEDHKLAATWRELQARRPATGDAVSPTQQDAPSRAADRSLPLVGRTAELARVVGLLADMPRTSGGCTLLLTGEPGVGKSRLLAEVVAAARGRGFHVIESRAREADRSRPYAAWRDQIGSVPLPDGDALAATAVARQHFLVDVSSRIIHDPSECPLLIVLDDVHWCDAASAELLHVIGTNARRPVTALLAARSGELADNAAVLELLRSLRHEGRLHEIELGPLDRASTERLVRSVAPGPEAAWIAAECNGNPLFAIALARDGQPRDGDSPPPSLKELISDRIERLPEVACEALSWASILGTIFSAERLHEVLHVSVESLGLALAALERHDFIRAAAGGNYVFVHDLIHRAVYTSLSEPRRRLMHLRVAGMLRDRPGGIEALADEIVHHAVRGGDSGMAAAACVEAGRRSLRLFANVEAAAFARRGLHHAQALPEPERVMRRIELTRIALLADRPSDIAEAAQALEHLADSALDHDRADHARMAYETLSLLRWERGFFTDAERDTLRAELVSRNADEGTRALAMAETARCLVMLGRDLPQADALLMEAAALARRLNIEPAAILDASGMIRARRGDFDGAASDFQRARLLARRDGDRITEFFALEHLVGLEFERGDFVAAEAVAGDMIRLSERLGAGSEGPFARSVAALCQFARGHSEAGADLEAAIADLSHADAKQRLSLVLRTVAAVDLGQGRQGDALRRATAALECATAIDCRSEIIAVEAILKALTPVPSDRVPAATGAVG